MEKMRVNEPMIRAVQHSRGLKALLLDADYGPSLGLRVVESLPKQRLY